MINIKDVKIGDCCFFKVAGQSAPIFGEIYKFSLDYNYIQIHSKEGYFTVWVENAYWEEKEAKKANYKKYESKN